MSYHYRISTAMFGCLVITSGEVSSLSSREIRVGNHKKKNIEIKKKKKKKTTKAKGRINIIRILMLRVILMLKIDIIKILISNY